MTRRAPDHDRANKAEFYAQKYDGRGLEPLPVRPRAGTHESLCMIYNKVFYR